MEVCQYLVQRKRRLLTSCIGEQIRSLLSPGENLNKASSSVFDLLSFPKCVKQLLAYLTRKSDPAAASLLRIMHAKSVTELRALTAQRDLYRAEWHDSWTEKGLDFVITVPHPFPAFKHGESEKVNLMTAGFTTIFSLVSQLIRTCKKIAAESVCGLFFTRIFLLVRFFPRRPF